MIVQGDPGDNLYVVASGTLEAFTQESGDVVQSYAKDTCFGELALLYNSPRACSVRCTSDAEIYGLGRLAFRKLVVDHNTQASGGIADVLCKVQHQPAQ